MQRRKKDARVQMVSLPTGLMAWLHNEVSGMLPFRKQCDKKENVPFPFHPNQSRRAVLSIALIFVFNSSLYFSSQFYYRTPKTSGGIHLEQSKQIYILLVWAPPHRFLFAQLLPN